MNAVNLPRRIGVIVGRDLIGDALIKLPMLRALRTAFPQSEICWITAQGPTAYGGELRDITRPLIDQIYEMPDWMPGVIKPNISALPSSQAEKETTKEAVQASEPPFFDILIDARNRWKWARQARKLPHKLFLAQAFHYALSDKRPNLLRKHPKHLVDRVLQLVELAAGWRPECTGRLNVPEHFIEQARNILPPGPEYVAFAPGAGNRVKCWPRYKFEKAAADQSQKGRVPVFLLGPAELSWHDEIKAHVPNAVFPLQHASGWGTEAVSIEHTMAIGCQLQVAVTNDSGTGHMLAAIDCPIISLFGPTSAEKSAPRVSKGTVVRAQDYGGKDMRLIPTEAVIRAIDTFLDHTEKNPLPRTKQPDKVA